MEKKPGLRDLADEILVARRRDVAASATGVMFEVTMLANAETEPEVTQARVLLVEDDLELAAEIVADLSNRGYGVSHVETGLAGQGRAREGGFDLLILDRMLPERDGLTVLEALRAAGVHTPVLILSALGAVDERVAGLKAGGDDYLVKPFAFVELAARIEALLRRPPPSPEMLLRVGPLMLDLIGRTARRGMREIELLPTEFKLLEYLMRHGGQLVTRSMLLEDVWHYRFLPHTNVVDVHIGKLRRKLDTADEAPMLHSIRGAGFMLRPPD
jgi:two-component system OmpR family response regulator